MDNGKTRFLIKSRFYEKCDFGMVCLIILAYFLVYVCIFVEVFSVSIFASILGWILNKFGRLLGSILGASWSHFATIGSNFC